MKKTVKIFAALVLSAVMTASFSACSNEQISLDTGNSSQTSVASQEESSAAASSAAESSAAESSAEESSKNESGAESSTQESSKEESTEESSGGGLSVLSMPEGSVSTSDIEDYINSSAGQELIKEFEKNYSTDEYDVKMSYQDGSLIFEMKFKEQQNLTDSQKETFEKMIESQFADQTLSTFSDMGLSLVIRIVNPDDSVIYEKDITSLERSSASSDSSSASSSSAVYASLEELFDDPSFNSQLSAMESQGSNESGTMKVFVEDKSKLVYEFTFKEAIDDSAASALDSAIDAYGSQMTTVLNTIKPYIEDKSISILVRYCNNDGSVLLEKEFK